MSEYNAAETHQVSDHYPRFIRETLIEAGLDDTICVMIHPGSHEAYSVCDYANGNGYLLQFSAAITRDHYDTMTGPELAAFVEERWEENLAPLRDWLNEDVL